MDYKLVGKTKKYCFDCGDWHEVEIREKPAVLQYRGQDIHYIDRAYYCPIQEKKDPNYDGWADADAMEFHWDHLMRERERINKLLDEK